VDNTTNKDLSSVNEETCLPLSDNTGKSPTVSSCRSDDENGALCSSSVDLNNTMIGGDICSEPSAISTVQNCAIPEINNASDLDHDSIPNAVSCEEAVSREGVNECPDSIRDSDQVIDSAEESLSFAHIMGYIQRGEQVPGVKDLNIQPTNLAATESGAIRKTKPWEHTIIQSSQ
jgi:hypothetical protein